MEYLIPVIGILIGYILGVLRDSNKIIFDKKVIVYSGIISEISKHGYLDHISLNKLIDLLAPARLLSGRRLEEKLRDYYSLVSEFAGYKNLNDENKMKEAVNKISTIIMEMEQLMRVELGSNRVYSKKTLIWHINKD
jgi:hypothetical protein